MIHKYNPNLLIGYYRLIPRRNLNSSYTGPDSPEYAAWQAENDQLAAVLEGSIDVIFPSLYVLHLGHESQTTEERWMTYARENISEARRLSDGKPVVAFLSMYYQENGKRSVDNRPTNPKSGQWIEPEFLLYQLTELSSLVDGAALYDDRNKPWTQFETAGIVEALDLFRQVADKGQLEELRSSSTTNFSRVAATNCWTS